MRFIENIGDYFSQHFFTDDFPKKVFDHTGYATEKKDAEGNEIANHLSAINQKIAPLREKYFRFKNDYLNVQRTKDKIKLGYDFHTTVLEVLGYTGLQDYSTPVYLNEKEIIPVRYCFYKGNNPYLYIMEMKPIIQVADQEPEGIYEQVYTKTDWEKVFPQNWNGIQLRPDIINEALSELFLLPKDERPEFVIMLAGPKIFLINYEKWKYDSFLLFDLEELFTESQVRSNRDYLSLFYALLSREQFLSDTEPVLNALEEDSHKAAYGVTQTLKNGVIYAVENLANEAIHYKLNVVAKTLEEKEGIRTLMAQENFARELKDECLSLVYRLLFLFYAESREDLEILPTKDEVYKKGYSLEMLRELEFVNLSTDSSRDGYFFSESLWKLFDFLYKGQPNKDGFLLRPLDSPLFDNAELKHLNDVHFRNHVLQQIILNLSISEKKAKSRRGRISYSNLGINQLGSVYESLLAYSGFFAAEDLIEVKAADDPKGKEGTFLVPKKRRDDFKETEILKDPEYPERDVEIKKGKFVYRLNGRDRKKSASYYTPEVLTQCTVKYTLKNILDKLKERQENGEDCADEILGLKILEPAMGAAAFHNEVINQLAAAYIELKEKEEVKKGRKRIIPSHYNDELQKVKAFIAANNVYGVDLNPTAVELGKLSLWLNCMHKGMETPFFAHRLGAGNAVVGAWLKVYAEKDVIVEYPKEGTKKQRETPLKKTWWEQAPKRVKWNKDGKLNRKENEIYHFLLPDENMVPGAGIKMLKEEMSEAEQKRFTEWKKAFYQPLRKDEVKRLQKISAIIDVLLEEHFYQIASINKETASYYQLYGQQVVPLPFKNYHEKERLAKARSSRTAPYYKLKAIMDYWCSFWFWDVRQVSNLPTRSEWYDELQSLIGINLNDISEATTPAQIKLALQQQVTSLTLFTENRLPIVNALANEFRFFHNELEFIEVFKEKGGFDVIVGNPPWVRVEFKEDELVSEFNPEVVIREMRANDVTQILKRLNTVDKFKILFIKELMNISAQGNFMSASANFSLLDGQQNNLYKSILENVFTLMSPACVCGILHPEGPYDDSSGGKMRRNIFQKLNYHFQFQNQLFLFDGVGDRFKFSINIYEAGKKTISFDSINNLFTPGTIDGCYSDNSKKEVEGIKRKEGKEFVWNTKSNRSRIVEINEEKLHLFNKAFEQGANYLEVKLPSIHCVELYPIISKIASFVSKIENYNYFPTTCWGETSAIKEGITKRETKYPDYFEYELIYGGPHFYVSNPILKTPKSKCTQKSHYDPVDLTEISEDYLPRTNYIPKLETSKFISKIETPADIPQWFEQFKLIWSRRLNQAAERTLQPSIILPKASHVHTVISFVFDREAFTIEAAGLSSSLILDFFTKTTGKADLYEETIQKFPIGIDSKYKEKLFVRVLLLNCLNKFYAPLWKRNWQNAYKTDNWSKPDIRLKSFDSLSEEWNWSNPLRNWYERRQALVEIDVITAMALGLTFQQLMLIYLVQFPILQQNEDDTWYDAKGNIVFTCNKALTGIGVDRKEWKKISQMKPGETYKHTITKSELYNGKEITYYAPFDKCDRVEDYEIAWSHFEQVFNVKEQEYIN